MGSDEGPDPEGETGLSLRPTLENKRGEAVTSSSAPAATDTTLQQGLHQDGRRLTPQRKRVLELFERCGSGCHLSAEEVHQQLAALEMKVSLATVYRTLRLLADMGLLQELELSEGGRRFELAVDDHRQHHHVVCIRCGRTEEFESETVLEAGAAAAAHVGFQLIESSLNVRAICPKCQG